MDDVTAAKLLINLLDLTSLNEDDNNARIEKFCQRAITPYGNVAAVCVYPRFVPTARDTLKGSGVKLATVVNFPHGGTHFEQMRQNIKTALAQGADEIDAVLPYKHFLSGDLETCNTFFNAVKAELNPKKTPLKVIIESGAFPHASLIADATRFCIDNGASFIKTSTGKTDVSATPEAANIILETIASGRRNVGFKASGGIKTTADAKQYLTLAFGIMGYKWVSPKNFRIGASSLLDSLLNTINQGY